MANLKAKYHEKLEPQESVENTVNQPEAQLENEEVYKNEEEPSEKHTNEQEEGIVIKNSVEVVEQNESENEEGKFDLEGLINKANSLKEEIPQLDQKINQLAEVLKEIKY